MPKPTKAEAWKSSQLYSESSNFTLNGKTAPKNPNFSFPRQTNLPENRKFSIKQISHLGPEMPSVTPTALTV
jgi:hypothetical protein